MWKHDEIWVKLSGIQLKQFQLSVSLQQNALDDLVSVKNNKIYASGCAGEEKWEQYAQ